MTAALAVALVLPGLRAASADDFETELARVDRALANNPAGVPEHALASCESRRNSAVRLYDSGRVDRAMRRLAYCKQVLKISEEKHTLVVKKGPSLEEIRENAAHELEKALTLKPNLENGLKVYRDCALCHGAEGWGLTNGTVPQIAGQHRKVVIKQLADIRAGNRENPLMLPYATVESIGGTQAVADVAGYIDTLEISVATGKGPGKDLERGQQIYAKNCARCHGAQGEGNEDEYVPRLQSQHFGYLVTQLDRIQDGERRNANPEMATLVQAFDDDEIRAVADYLSRLEPPEDLQAPPGWHNPDFAK